jgi:alpha-ribazole phosphatase
MKLILIRHGETRWNAIQKYQGHTDIPLNDRGRQQAARLAEHLKATEQVEAVYCSDLLRAHETAAIVARPFQIEPVSDSRLREFHFGNWEGLTFNQVYASYREEFEQWFNNPEDFRVPGGESFSDLARRSLEAIEDVCKKHAGTTLIITHGGVIKVMLCQLQSISNPWQETVPPGSLTEINLVAGRMQLQHFGVVV